MSTSIELNRVSLSVRTKEVCPYPHRFTHASPSTYSTTLVMHSLLKELVIDVVVLFCLTYLVRVCQDAVTRDGM